MTIRTRPATDSYRDGWDLAFGGERVQCPLCGATCPTIADGEGLAVADCDCLERAAMAKAMAAFAGPPLQLLPDGMAITGKAVK